MHQPRMPPHSLPQLTPLLLSMHQPRMPPHSLPQLTLPLPSMPQPSLRPLHLPHPPTEPPLHSEQNFLVSNKHTGMSTEYRQRFRIQSLYDVDNGCINV